MHFFEATFTKVEVSQFMKAAKGFFAHRSNRIGPKVGDGLMAIYYPLLFLVACY